MRLRLLAAWSTFALALPLAVGCSDADTQGLDAQDPTTLTVTIQNVSDMSGHPTPIAPGIWVIHTEGEPLFTVGERDRGEGLEMLAEDGSPDDLERSLSVRYSAEPFDATLDDYVEAADPGESLVFDVEVKAGDRLSFAAMVVESNDFFVGTPAGGIALFDDEGEPFLGSVEVKIWDAGTEIDQTLGQGEDQPMRQSGPNTGDPENAAVEESELDSSDFVTVSISRRVENRAEPGEN